MHEIQSLRMFSQIVGECHGWHVLRGQKCSLHKPLLDGIDTRRPQFQWKIEKHQKYCLDQVMLKVCAGGPGSQVHV